MKNMIMLLEFGCIVFLLVFSFTNRNSSLLVGKEPPAVVVKDTVKDALSLLKSADAVESKKGAEQIFEIKRTIEKELYKIVIDEEVTYCFPDDAKPAKLNALRLLGDFRCQEAIEVLYINLLYGIGNSSDEAGVPSPPPPALESLMVMGKPSADFLLDAWRDEFGLMNDAFGNISYHLPTKTMYLDSEDSIDPKNNVDSIYNKESFPNVYELFSLIITCAYSEGQVKYFVQEALDRYSSGKDRENVIKNMKKMSLMYD